MPDDDEVQVYAAEIELPTDAVVQFGLFMVAYFTADGTVGYRFNLSESVHASAILGLMEIVKEKILHETMG